MKIPIFILIIVFLSFQQSPAQQIPISNGLHRVFLTRADTSYEFYASIPEKKFSAQPAKIYFWYRPDTILMTKGGYSGRILDGSYKEYFPDKNLKVKGQFAKGLKEGEWTFWHPNGQMREVEHWKAGFKQGLVIKYNNQGAKIAQEFYKNDLRKGMQLQFNAAKQTFDTAFFKNGIRVIKDSTIKKK